MRLKMRIQKLINIVFQIESDMETKINLDRHAPKEERHAPN